MELPRCHACARTLLVGERFAIRRRAQLERAVCDLCADKPRSALPGETVRRERVRSALGAASVERVLPAPAGGPRPLRKAPVP